MEKIHSVTTFSTQRYKLIVSSTADPEAAINCSGRQAGRYIKGWHNAKKRGAHDEINEVAGCRWREQVKSQNLLSLTSEAGPDEGALRQLGHRNLSFQLHLLNMISTTRNKQN